MASAFELKKAQILEQLNAPEETYTDRSPKGSIDAGIRTLVDEINELEGLVTTSSCAGRISVFLEGQKGPKKTAGGPGGHYEAADDEDIPAELNPVQASSVGGKGGGQWLFVSHDALALPDHGVLAGLKFRRDADTMRMGSRLVRIKFEPMVRLLEACFQ
jgi:tRNA wybutosine-synthesizing protein 3